MKYAVFEELHAQLCERARGLTAQKGHDYSGTEDTLRNLKAVTAFGVSPEQGTLVRMTDKLSRMYQLTQPGVEPAVADEALMDTVLDMINYSVLLWALMEERRQDDEA